ncbi:MAG: Na+/H+ antiporter NhaC family protein [Venatoribacter sp.]
MNAVVIAVVLMLALSVARMHVMLAMIIAAFVGGLVGGLDLNTTIAAFNKGIGGGAGIALSYAMLGGFAVAISLSGLPNLLADAILKRLGVETIQYQKLLKSLLLGLLLMAAIFSQNLIPIHIAFIPILIPPLLMVMARLNLDRRLVACVLTFGLITPYMFLPVGFGNIYLHEILLGRIAQAGMDVQGLSVVKAMFIPALGMLFGLLVAMFFSYRKPRQYNVAAIKFTERTEGSDYDKKSLYVAAVAVVVTFATQLYTDSMVLGAMAGFLVFSVTGVIKSHKSEDVLGDGIKMMASIGFIMISAQGFAEVMTQTGHIDLLVEESAAWLADSKGLAAFVLLLVGLLLTLGIGSSFSTVPIIAAIYVPLCLQMGFSPLAIVSLVGTAGVLGDAGSPASDSTLGPTAGLNVDGQHNHMRDTVVPTFLHYNLPLMLFGWVAAMVL